MATRLTKTSIERAIDHLSRFGDTDVLPHQPELMFLHENRSIVADELAMLDLDKFMPLQAIEVLAPKSKTGFRVIHQLNFLDTLLLTAATIEIANDLESLKKPADGFGPFAYRFDNSSDVSLFQENRNYRDWIKWQSEILNLNTYSEVVLTDISDFYNRIYLHRIENTLDSATSNKGVKRFIERVIKQIRSKQSFGIPVGGSASRIIAEAVLSDADNALEDEGYEFTRFVDDYRIFLQDGQSSYRAISFLAELLISEGLSLNNQKTLVLKEAEFRSNIEEESNDASSEAESNAFEILSNLIYFEETEGDDEAIRELKGLNLIEMLENEISGVTWDFGRVKGLIRALRLTENAEVLQWIEPKFETLLPFVKEILLLADDINQSGSDKKLTSETIIRLLDSGPASSVPAIRVWLLEFFVREAVVLTRREVRNFTINDTLCLRQLHLIRGILSDVSYFRTQKTRFESLSIFEKYTCLLGATCLPRDEFETWVSAVRPNMTRPLDAKFCDWVKQKHGRLKDLLVERVRLTRE